MIEIKNLWVTAGKEQDMQLNTGFFLCFARTTDPSADELRRQIIIGHPMAAVLTVVGADAEKNTCRFRIDDGKAQREAEIRASDSHYNPNRMNGRTEVEAAPGIKVSITRVTKTYVAIRLRGEREFAAVQGGLYAAAVADA